MKTYHDTLALNELSVGCAVCIKPSPGYAIHCCIILYGSH